MSDNISSKVLDEVGKVSSEALKGVTDPFIRIAFALMVILNLIGFGIAIGMLVLGHDNATYAFIACMVMILVDFIIVILLIMKRTSKIADMNAQTTALNSIYNANVQIG
jgi:heme/copper-type cytochrome/quinol oxidase subunit 4